jgi:hypothetical protein
MALRTDLRYNDLQPIIDLHGRVFAAECGWNVTFKASSITKNLANLPVAAGVLFLLGLFVVF